MTSAHSTSTTKDMGLVHPCGHASDFEDGCIKRDHFRCPACGLLWHMEQAPPIQYPSGYIAPGKRTLVIDQQQELALHAC